MLYFLVLALLCGSAISAPPTARKQKVATDLKAINEKVNNLQNSLGMLADLLPLNSSVEFGQAALNDTLTALKGIQKNFIDALKTIQEASPKMPPVAFSHLASLNNQVIAGAENIQKLIDAFTEAQQKNASNVEIASLIKSTGKPVLGLVQSSFGKLKSICNTLTGKDNCPATDILATLSFVNDGISEFLKKSTATLAKYANTTDPIIINKIVNRLLKGVNRTLQAVENGAMKFNKLASLLPANVSSLALQVLKDQFSSAVSGLKVLSGLLTKQAQNTTDVTMKNLMDLNNNLLKPGMSEVLQLVGSVSNFVSIQAPTINKVLRALPTHKLSSSITKIQIVLSRAANLLRGSTEQVLQANGTRQLKFLARQLDGTIDLVSNTIAKSLKALDNITANLPISSVNDLNVLSVVKDTLLNLQNSTQGLKDTLTKTLAGPLDKKSLLELIGNVKPTLASLTKTAMKASSVVNSVSDSINKTLGTVANTLTNTATSAVNLSSNTLNTAINTASSTMQTATNTASNVVNALPVPEVIPGLPLGLL